MVLQGASGALAPDATLRVASTDFLAMGGDTILAPAAPPGGLQVSEEGVLLRDAVDGWLRARGGRLNECELTKRAASIWTLPGPPPLNCSR